ncbi:uncharacterized protein BDW70DRAFT_144854 [Aspergillus foveolatus]|uniref:uncharacterized protein n=1 Tax=Aspergillus foveolatus TaxID=210207 RepID=UPI003CCD2BD0
MGIASNKYNLFSLSCPPFPPTNLPVIISRHNCTPTKMKPTFALLSLSALPLSTAWEFTWRDSSGKATTEEGTGPSECIVIDHAKGQLFVMDGEGEKNINMLLFKNDKCEGEPAGMATESFAKEASVDLKGFQVVEYGSSESGSGNATTTETTTGSDADGTVTLPTVSSTSTSTSTDDEDEDGTVTLPTVSATTTATTTDESSTAEPTTTTATESGSDSETSSTEPTSTESAGAEEEPTPTGASSRLAPISLAGLAAVILGAVAGGF